jgi:hypothetical protein
VVGYAPAPQPSFAPEQELPPAPMKRNSSSVLKWALIGVGLVAGLLVGAGLATRSGGRKDNAAQPPTQASTVAAAGAVIETPGAKPSGSELTQPSQPDASAPAPSGATDSSALETCIFGGQKPALVCLSEELDRRDARLSE